VPISLKISTFTLVQGIAKRASVNAHLKVGCRKLHACAMNKFYFGL